jgi:multidrug efflux system membrane fusion protein
MLGRALVFIFLAAIVAVIVANDVSRRYFSYSGDAFVTTDFVAVAPQVAGRLHALSVTDNQWVADGDRLFEIDPRPYRLALASAEASLDLSRISRQSAQDALDGAIANAASARAVLDDARATRDRLRGLFENGVVAQQRLDDANRDLATATEGLQRALSAVRVARDGVKRSAADVAAATAARDLADFRLSQTAVTAPMSGYVAPFDARVGAFLDIGEDVLAIVSDARWRVVVNLPEERLAHLAVGQPAWMMLASDPWRVVRGRVASVSRGIARSPDGVQVVPYVAPTTEWIRLSRRFPVEIGIDAPDALTLYKGADARVFVRHGRAEADPDPGRPVEDPQQ